MIRNVIYPVVIGNHVVRISRDAPDIENMVYDGTGTLAESVIRTLGLFC